MSKILDSLLELANLPSSEVLELADIRRAIRYDDVAYSEMSPRVYRRLVRKIRAGLRSLDSIPAQVQVSCVSLYDGATRAIGELLCVEAQEAAIADFPDDLPILLKTCVKYKHISEALWKKLVVAAKRDELSPRVIKLLSARSDCPPQFLKAVGTMKATPVKAAPVKQPKAPRKAKVVEDDYFDDESDGDWGDDEPAAPVRNVRRPRP